MISTSSSTFRVNNGILIVDNITNGNDRSKIPSSNQSSINEDCDGSNPLNVQIIKVESLCEQENSFTETDRDNGNVQTFIQTNRSLVNEAAVDESLITAEIKIENDTIYEDSCSFENSINIPVENDTDPLAGNFKPNRKKMNRISYGAKNAKSNILTELMQIERQKKRNRNKHKCEICQKKYHSKEYLAKHVLIHSREQPLKCRICEYRTAHKSMLKQHMRTNHKGRNSFPCPICPVRFLKKLSLNQHMRVHSDKRKFKCDVCHKFYAYKQGLQNHVCLANEPAQYECNVCQKTYLLKTNMERHMLFHAKTCPFNCESCQITFNTAEALERHMQGLHKSKEPLVCDICQAEFTRKVNLAVHIRSHLRTEELDCKICGKVYQSKRNLKRHVDSHSKIKSPAQKSEQKKFKCNVCKKNYSQKKFFEKHMLGHKGVTPFECKFCHLKFAKKIFLQQHVCTIGKKQFQCDICRRVYCSSYTLKKHVLTHEKKDN